MGIPFSLAAFNSLSLSLIFVCLINMCLGVLLLGFLLYGTLHFLDLTKCFFFHVRKVFSSYVFKYFSSISSPSFSPKTPRMKVLILFDILVILLYFFSMSVISTTIFHSLIDSSALFILPFISSIKLIFHFSYCVFQLWLFFICSILLLKRIPLFCPFL